jgi:hypothetical protein
MAWSHDAGLPIRIAVAIVSGSSIGWPLTRGAAPAAWKPHMTGSLVAGPGWSLTAGSAEYSRYPFQYAVMLPALPTGRQWISGASPSASTISNAAVFWPSMRAGLTELTSSTG